MSSTQFHGRSDGILALAGHPTERSSKRLGTVNDESLSEFQTAEPVPTTNRQSTTPWTLPRREQLSRGDHRTCEVEAAEGQPEAAFRAHFDSSVF
jgi:hypothetical protein